MIEFIWALALETKTICAILVTLYFVVVVSIFVTVGPSGDDLKKGLSRAFKLLPIVIVLFMGTIIPSPKDLLKIRLGLIGFELVSPENVKKGSDEIEKIIKKLECKYLEECEKDKK